MYGRRCFLLAAWSLDTRLSSADQTWTLMASPLSTSGTNPPSDVVLDTLFISEGRSQIAHGGRGSFNVYSLLLILSFHFHQRYTRIMYWIANSATVVIWTGEERVGKLDRFRPPAHGLMGPRPFPVLQFVYPTTHPPWWRWSVSWQRSLHDVKSCLGGPDSAATTGASTPRVCAPLYYICSSSARAASLLTEMNRSLFQ